MLTPQEGLGTKSHSGMANAGSDGGDVEQAFHEAQAKFLEAYAALRSATVAYRQSGEAERTKASPSDHQEAKHWSRLVRDFFREFSWGHQRLKPPAGPVDALAAGGNLFGCALSPTVLAALRGSGAAFDPLPQMRDDLFFRDDVLARWADWHAMQGDVLEAAKAIGLLSRLDADEEHGRDGYEH